MAEFEQLLENQIFHGKYAHELSHEQKRGAGDMLSNVEEKINRGHTDENPVLRARSVYNGKVQRGLYTKEETAAPTVAIDSFFITSLVDAIEQRDIAITDVKSAYLNAKMKGQVIMKIRGREVELFCQLDPSLRKFTTKENDKTVLYVQLDKA